MGLDGAEAFVRMARQGTGAEVWHQDFLALDLPAETFDGVFANATLFHVPGDGYGGFGPARQVALPGTVTAMAIGEMNRRDGLADVVVAVSGDSGSQLFVYEGPDGALMSRPEAIDLPEPARAYM